MEPTNEQRKYMEHMTDAEIAAACLIDVVGQLMIGAESYTGRGETEPEWIQQSTGLLKCALAHLVPQLSWEQAVMMAAQSLRD